MSKTFAYFLLLCLFLTIMGCGGEDKITEPPPVLEPGLSGNTYLNTKFCCKITELPVDDWTVKTYGNDGQGKMIYNDSEYGIASYIMILMEPVPADQFIDVDEGKYLGSILNAKMPFIGVWVYEYADTNIPNYEFMEIMRFLHADTGLHETKPIAGANCTGYQVTGQYHGDEDDGTITLSWFMKNNILLEVGYFSGNDKYMSYLGAYNHVVNHFMVMGNRFLCCMFGQKKELFLL